MSGQVAVVVAGGTVAWGDSGTHATRKALLEIEGRPMVHWVLDALVDSGVVDTLVVVGLDSEDLPAWAGRAGFVPDAGGLVANVLAAKTYVNENHADCGHVLLSSCDIPLLNGAMVRRFLDQCGDRMKPVYYALVTEGTMNSRFPSSGRTFIRMRGGRITGGNLVLVDPSTRVNLEFVERSISLRKHALSLAFTLGWGFVFRFALGLVTPEGAAERLSQLVGPRLSVVICPDAEVAMDVDKLIHYERVQREFGEAG